MAIDLGRLTLGPAMRLYAARVLYGRPAEPPFHLRGVFDRQHVEVFDADGAAVSTRRAQLGVQLAAFPDGMLPLQGDLVQVAIQGEQQVDLELARRAGVTLESFVVADVQQDGAGGAVLILGARTPDPLT